MQPFDRWFASSARRVARRTSRRHFLARLGAALLGGAALPLLPLARSAAASREPAPGEPDPGTPAGDPSSCGYWRHCAIDGFLASCCGGTHTSCPPGTQMSPITWLGTCRNPADGKEYVISYNDCCGKGLCGRCFCKRNEGDRPVYYASKSNDINWCMGSAGVVYNSTVAIAVGVATERSGWGASGVASLLASAFASAAAAQTPGLDYMLQCRGCHLEDGSGAPGAVPSLQGVGRFLGTSRGREYLIRVPGSAQSPLSDAALAKLLDWIVQRFDPETAAAGFAYFDAEEVARWRSTPLIEVEVLRAALLEELARPAASSAEAGE